MILRTRSTTEYSIASRRSRMTLHVAVCSDGSGTVSGWIWNDGPRLDLVDAYLAPLPVQWDRGGTDHFIYSFGPGVLSERTALDLNEIMDRNLRRRRTARKAKGG